MVSSQMCINILIGIGTGVTSSLLIFVALYMIKPKVEVATEIISKKEKNILTIKIVNVSMFDVIDLDYALFFCVDKGDGVIKTKRIKSLQKTFPMINKYDLKDKKSKYAIRLVFDYTELEEALSKKENEVFLTFKIIARHRFSNGIFSKVVEYHKNDLIENGIYETGKSCKVIRP